MADVFPLKMLAAGQRARIDQLVGRPEEVHRLKELGMREGVAIEMLQSGSTCIIKLDGAKLAFRDEDSFGVLVRLGEAG
jgi:Fe2+ transport system protein FeoA